MKTFNTRHFWLKNGQSAGFNKLGQLIKFSGSRVFPRPGSFIYTNIMHQRRMHIVN